MELSIHDRALIAQILPEQGNIMTIRAITDLKTKVLPSADDVEALGVEQGEDGGYKIDIDLAKESISEMEFNSVESGIISSALKKLDESGMLTESHIHLWDKFCS